MDQVLDGCTEAYNCLKIDSAACFLLHLLDMHENNPLKPWFDSILTSLPEQTEDKPVGIVFHHVIQSVDCRFDVCVLHSGLCANRLARLCGGRDCGFSTE